MPWFLFNKASPLNPVQLSTFSKLANQNSLSTQLPNFCKFANLLCFPDLSPSLVKHKREVNFGSYLGKNFTNYGTDQVGDSDTFNKYSTEYMDTLNSFHQYSHHSIDHAEKFSSYSHYKTNFKTYGTNSRGGVGHFSSYSTHVNVPDLHFTSYSNNGNRRNQNFKTYAFDANAGSQSFTSYAKNEKGGENDFTTYGNISNVMSSTFSNYGRKGNSVKDNFASYGSNSNLPKNNFNVYGDGGKAATETFANYRDFGNVGDDSFQSYSRGSNAAHVKFVNYAQGYNGGTDKFKGYGQNAKGQTMNFKIYGVDNTFKEYAKKGVSFSTYMNDSSSSESVKTVNNRWVEPGKFFREKMLKTGGILPMPDITDKMPQRSFLPRAIMSKIPFSVAKIGKLKELFNAEDNSTMTKMLTDSLSECERPPSPGETKQCVGSVEDMIDFSTSVLGRNIGVRSTENTKGSNGNIMIGLVRGINGGKITKSVSCHQSLFPSLLYYCHSVPKVRVYEADILDVKSRTKINHGIAICHIDTSTWSSSHGAFMALGSGPGKIEVCHWIFENDMIWTVADLNHG